jgi:DNA-binding XRE family transcriptional regulator
MIKDKRQYEYSKDCAKKFAYSIELIEKDEDWKQRDTESWQLDIDVKSSHLKALQEEIDEYERLISCNNIQPIKVSFESLHELLDTLIKARIAAKISQKQLAEILGIDEQRIKQCEDKNYRCATVSEIIQVSAALGIEMNGIIKVDFEEIKLGIKTGLERNQRQTGRMNLQSKAS